MPTALTQLLTQLQAVWSPLSRTQKLSLIGVAIAAVIAIAYFGVAATQTPYATLFTRLNDQDAGAIVARLRELNVPYQLADGGATIRVPEAQVHETRLQLARVGLPKSGTVGFELFDNQNLLSLTDFSQRMNYQRALEG
ncbi:MAG: flagellar M-ring protein FliF, partial [Dehalococcoidia bacterium]|nr:flagellar M-ring protein FliF [Dehalococcoidia bacterium]